MTRLFSTLLTLVIVLAPVSIVYGQDPGGIDSLAFGNPDGSPLPVYIDDNIVVPIWLKCDENIAFVHFCLATDNDYIAERQGISPYGILQQWDLMGTLPVDSWPEVGLTSQSIVGIADFSLPEPNYINTNSGWVEIGAFLMGTSNNPDLMGQISQLLPGEDPLEGITLMFDEFWTPIVPDMVFSALDFQVNRPPVINSPVDDTLIFVNNLYPFSFPIIATDEDGDDIVLDLDFPYSDYEFTEVEHYPGYAHYLFSWTPPETCCAVLDLNLMATDAHGIDTEGNAYLDVSPVSVIVSSDTTLPGYPAGVDVRLLQSGNNSNVGSFNLTFVWDPNSLLLQNVEFGDELADWDYINSAINPLGPGSLRLIGVANMTGAIVPPLKQGDHSIASIFFVGASDPDLGGLFIPLDMPINDFSNNVLSDSTGYLVYHPGLDEGGVLFLNFGDILIGDINLNHLPYEAGDAIAFVNHLTDPVQFPFNLTQHFASDCNQDGLAETIADLVFMLNILNGGGLTLDNSVQLMTANLRLDITGSTVMAKVQSDTEIGGALVRINHAGVKLDRLSAPDNLELYYSDDGDVLTAVVYSRDMNLGISSDLLSVNIIEGNSANIVIEYFEISDIRGNLLTK